MIDPSVLLPFKKRDHLEEVFRLFAMFPFQQILLSINFFLKSWSVAWKMSSFFGRSFQEHLWLLFIVQLMEKMKHRQT